MEQEVNTSLSSFIAPVVMHKHTMRRFLPLHWLNFRYIRLDSAPSALLGMYTISPYGASRLGAHYDKAEAGTLNMHPGKGYACRERRCARIASLDCRQDCHCIFLCVAALLILEAQLVEYHGRTNLTNRGT